MRLFDSHAHLTDERFASELDLVLDRAAAAGVEAVVSIASDLEDAEAAIELSHRTASPRVFATAGIHPHAADRCTERALQRLEALAGSEERVVAVGETGLDFHYENAPRDVQQAAFRGQIEVAERLGLPIVVHSRDADEPLAEVLEGYAGRVTGVLHCFSGGAVLLHAGLEAGWYVSFAGIVTFKNFDGDGLVRSVPSDRLLVETDSPYLAPAPRRGKRNEPAFVEHVLRRVAAIRGDDVEELAEITHRNACRFYGLEPVDPRRGPISLDGGRGAR